MYLYSSDEAGTADQSPEERLGELETKFAEYSEQMQSLDTMFNNQMTQLQNQLTELEKEFCALVDRINLRYECLPLDDI